MAWLVKSYGNVKLLIANGWILSSGGVSTQGSATNERTQSSLNNNIQNNKFNCSKVFEDTNHH